MPLGKSVCSTVRIEENRNVYDDDDDDDDDADAV